MQMKLATINVLPYESYQTDIFQAVFFGVMSRSEDMTLQRPENLKSRNFKYYITNQPT